MGPGDGTDQFRERFLRTFLDWVMLAILQRKPAYGYEMITIIDAEFRIYVSPGSLYPILYNLERSGYVTGAWEQPDRKSRKVYTITPEGERVLREGLDTLGRVLTTLRRDAEEP